MPNHNTHQTITNCLKEAVNCLTQGQKTLAQNHASLSPSQTTMNSKIDSNLEWFVALTTTLTSPKSPTTPTPPSYSLPHMKHDVPNSTDRALWVGFFKFHSSWIIRAYVIMSSSWCLHFTWKDWPCASTCACPGLGSSLYGQQCSKNCSLVLFLPSTTTLRELCSSFSSAAPLMTTSQSSKDWQIGLWVLVSFPIELFRLRPEPRTLRQIGLWVSPSVNDYFSNQTPGRYSATIVAIFKLHCFPRSRRHHRHRPLDLPRRPPWGYLSNASQQKKWPFVETKAFVTILTRNGS